MLRLNTRIGGSDSTPTTALATLPLSGQSEPRQAVGWNTRASETAGVLQPYVGVAPIANSRVQQIASRVSIGS